MCCDFVKFIKTFCRSEKNVKFILLDSSNKDLPCRVGGFLVVVTEN